MSSFCSHVHPALVMCTPVAMGEALHPAIGSSTELEVDFYDSRRFLIHQRLLLFKVTREISAVVGRRAGNSSVHY